MQRIVHFDLKGAPLKVPYMEKVLQSVKLWGATGILLEWEDTFPYSSELEVIGSKYCPDRLYSVEEVQRIMQFAKGCGLEVIQLVQTIGHMEFVLKHPTFRALREMPRSPAVMCPSRPESQALVRAMLDQVLEQQPDANYIHIGADEVWHMGICHRCQSKAALSEHKTASLYLQHIRNLVIYLKQKRPNLTVLMWDDMLRSISLNTMLAYQLGELVEPVVWHYNRIEYFQIESSVWETYNQIFPKVWAGSAYKGANGSCQILSPVNRYTSNQEAWMYEMQINCPNTFAGIVLTGWSRYDHYATMCELMPVSLPCLASCLKILNKTDDQTIESLVCEVLPSDEWPSEILARCIHAFVELREKCNSFINGDLVMTWLNPWQLLNEYTSPLQVEGMVSTAVQYITELKSLQDDMITQLHIITGRRSTEEWIKTYVMPILTQLVDLHENADTRSKCEAGVYPVM